MFLNSVTSPYFRENLTYLKPSDYIFSGAIGFHLLFAFMFILVESCKKYIKPILPNQFKSEATFIFILQRGSKGSWKTSRLFEDWKLVKNQIREKSDKYFTPCFL